MIYNQVINAVLENYIYFFSTKTPEPFTSLKKTHLDVELDLVIIDTLEGAKGCDKTVRFKIKDLKLDDKYNLIPLKDCKDLGKCIIVRLSRICFKNENNAYFYVSLNREKDFARLDKITLKKRQGTWLIEDIQNISIS